MNEGERSKGGGREGGGRGRQRGAGMNRAGRWEEQEGGEKEWME